MTAAGARSAWRRETRPSVGRSETGMVALALALAVTFFLFITVAIVVQTGWSGTDVTASSRQQSVALDAADGALNLAYGTVQTTSPLPCTLPSYTFASSPAPSTATVSVSYFSSNPPSGTPITCNSNQVGPTQTPASALLVAAATSGRAAASTATQYMEEELIFNTQSTGSVFQDALFSNLNMNLQQSVTINSSTNSADVYVANTSGGTGATCANSTIVHGNVTVQGPFTAQSSCVVEANVYAWNLYLQDSAQIEGYASADDIPCSGSNLENTLQNGQSVAKPPGTITLNNCAKIVGDAYACSTVTTNNSSTVGSKVADDSSPPASPDGTESFPVTDEDYALVTAWEDAGWTVNQSYATCPGTNPFLDGLPSYSGNTVFMTSCPVQDFNSNRITLSANLAIISTGGFWLQNSSSWTSNNSTTRDVYLEVPTEVNGTSTTCTAVPSGNYSSNSPPPSNPNILTKSSASFSNTLDVLLYTPCTVSLANSSVSMGQIYGGQVSVSNSVSFTYAQLPQPPGFTGGAGTQTSQVNLAFVRQSPGSPTIP